VVTLKGGTMTDSILNSVKKILGITEDYIVFDVDIITHINSVFATLNELGIGPEDGFMITDESTLWSAYILNDQKLNAVKSYMYLRVRLLFDPPTTSYLITSLNEQAKELEWRLNVIRDFRAYPMPPEDPEFVYSRSVRRVEI